MTQTRREAALALATDLLTDIELSRVPAPDYLKKASRLARLLDDVDAVEWLSFEMHGYPKPLSKSASRAARRSNRGTTNEETGEPALFVSSMATIQANIDSSKAQLAAASDGSVSVSSANPAQTVRVPEGNARERGLLREFVASQTGLLGLIVGSIHSYVAEKEIELRFGAAIESAFEVVRNKVDAQIAEVVPNGAIMLSAAFENAASGNPEHWANAASACRRLLKDLADELQPAGGDVAGRKMGAGNYVNRLVFWIEQRLPGSTMTDVVSSDLEDFGKRLDAIDGAGQKGAHDNVTQYDASRFITGAYLLLGDILNLRAAVNSAESSPASDTADTAVE